MSDLKRFTLRLTVRPIGFLRSEARAKGLERKVRVQVRAESPHLARRLTLNAAFKRGNNVSSIYLLTEEYPDV